MLRKIIFLLALLLLPSRPAAAHTTVLVPMVLPAGRKVVRVVHFHPFAASDLMGIRLGAEDSPQLKGLEQIFVIHRGRIRDLEQVARPDFCTIAGRRGATYTIPWDRENGFVGAGDYVFIVRHKPHWKPAEGIYRQKIAKLYCNLGDMVTDWPRRLLTGAPEIIPLVSPTGSAAGALFRAEAVSDAGRPLAHARIEVEYLSRLPGAGRLPVKMPVASPGKESGNTFFFTDRQGTFAFIPPRPGLWTFTLVDGDEHRQLRGKELEYDSSLSLLVR